MFLQSTDDCLLRHSLSVHHVCLSLPVKEENFMARKLARSSHEATADGSSGFIGRDHETKKRKYQNRTILGRVSSEEVPARHDTD
jgi:hypothetical protein